LQALPFAVATLAVWRVTHFLVEEDGPFDVAARLRGVLGRAGLERLLGCFFCCSVWVAAGAACWIASPPGEVVLATAALSGAAILLERTTTRAPAAAWAEAQEDDDGMLRR
jgi:hypothetical protein